jgi:hypothetical protein
MIWNSIPTAAADIHNEKGNGICHYNDNHLKKGVERTVETAYLFNIPYTMGSI